MSETVSVEDEVAARRAYIKAFGKDAPYTQGVTYALVVRAITEALERGSPIPDDFDWYPDLPPDAVV